MPEEQDILERVLRANNDMIALGMTWDQIEDFYKKCFTISKESINS